MEVGSAARLRISPATFFGRGQVDSLLARVHATDPQRYVPRAAVLLHLLPLCCAATSAAGPECCAVVLLHLLLCVPPHLLGCYVLPPPALRAPCISPEPPLHAPPCNAWGDLCSHCHPASPAPCPTHHPHHAIALRPAAAHLIPLPLQGINHPRPGARVITPPPHPLAVCLSTTR